MLNFRALAAVALVGASCHPTRFRDCFLEPSSSAFAGILIGGGAGALIVPILLILLFPSPLMAQGRSQGFVSVGAGATDLNGGLDWVIAGGPIGIGAEVGAGSMYFAAFTGSYHFLTRRSGTHDVFATVGYAGLGSSEFAAQGVTVGGGATFWPATHLGLRFDAFRFLPVATENRIPADERSASPYWGLRAGIAFRFR